MVHVHVRGTLVNIITLSITLRNLNEVNYFLKGREALHVLLFNCCDCKIK